MGALAWLIPLFPLAAYAVLIFRGRALGDRAAFVAIGAMSVSTLLALAILGAKVFGAPDFVWRAAWAVGGDREITIGFTVDNLSAIMTAMVTFVGTLIFVYSVGYMHGDPYYSRFFAFLSLFCFGMLTMVLANSFLLMLIGWEIIGLCSYLLIGFYFRRKSANAAQIKAFMTTRVGDFLMLIGIMMVFWQFGTVDYHAVFDAIRKGGEGAARTVALGGWQIPLVTLTALMIFGGPIGKSGQFPLHVWLPDAMEGPTPVSALIHAATMVAAGVYLVGRAYPLFFFTPHHEALLFVAWIGTITALMAGLIALAQDDIKRILAYSTISQLGFMMAGLGVLGYAAGLFHLLTHAFFKALLFLGAGSVIHSVHTNNIKEMGGLRRHMPVTFWTFAAGFLALVGIFPFAGFWSKDEILLEAFHHNPAIYYALTAGAFLTALYMSRLMAYTFFGAYRGTKHPESDPWLPEDYGRHSSLHGPSPMGHGATSGEHRPHESPRVMTAPLVVLAACSLVVGFVGAPGTWEKGSWIHHFLEFEGFKAAGIEAPAFSWPLALRSLAAALAGVGVAWVVYGLRVVTSDRIRAWTGPLYGFLRNRMYFDHAYGLVFVRGGLALASLVRIFDERVVDGIVNFVGYLIVGISRIHRFFDTYVVDGLVNLIGVLTRWIGLGLRYVQTGRVYNYILVVAVGLTVVVIVGLWRL
ncbi:MAG: NADH-quinone oxidoreductase subunit L [Armatimonadota bacterium]|nr:NADH-quinone oxidoreductase subunit L [Armatimonadota bacterium]MDR5696246.1 NADH-quinone oxidoreductase subunit L [Armatimonadota bacterium]